ncbi:hypothetical protein ACSLBF_17885 (plasmid) [Pseudoalteromonas sp. T1lg65]|uniref:hypothetical protein n=1 Tax=Pseudoalteromonas sp. T1lg65 TaxID=2077101 RepID=UPI003F792B46
MIYITLTALLCILGLLTFIPKYKHVIEKYSLGINFFMTVIATLIGVLLAIVITNYDEERKETRDVIKLLNSAVAVVNVCLESSEHLIQFYEKLPDNDATKGAFFDHNPLTYPEYIDWLLKQNLVSKNISSEVLQDLNEHIITLKKVKNTDHVIFQWLLELLIALLELEIKFQKGEIDELQLDKLTGKVERAVSEKIREHQNGK